MKEERWYILALFSIFFAALALRLILPLEFNVWGPDTGENYYITHYFAVSGAMPSPYYGFGRTYTEFPAVYVLVALIARLTGISTAAAVELSMPFITSLLVFPMAGIAVSLTGRKQVGLMASIFYATSVVVIGHTSIIASDTMGEVILVFFIYFYLASGRDRLTIALAMATALAMIPTYHLGTVILLLFLFSALFYYSLFRRSNSAELLKALAFILVITTLTWAYWMTMAPNFLSTFVLKNTGLGIEEAVSAPYILTFLIFIAGSFVQRRGRASGGSGQGRDGMPLAYPVAAFAASAAAVGYIAYFGYPSVPLYPGPVILFNIPTVAVTLLAFTAVIPSMRDGRKFHSIGITLFLLASLIGLGVVTNIPYLVPERLVEYLLLFAATFAGIAMLSFLDLLPRSRRTAAALALCLVLILAAGLSTALVGATTTPSKIGGTPAADLSAAQWLHISTPGASTVASDHRLSSIVFGFAQRNATWEMGSYPIYTAANASSMENQLNLTFTPSGYKTVNYLLMDTYMIQAGNFYPNQTAIPVSPAVLAAVRGGNFVNVYSNGFATVYAYTR